MKSKIFTLNLRSFLLALVLVALPIAAADLNQAKSAGLVGEQISGFLGLVKMDAPADVKAMVDSINAQRLAEYQRIANKNGVTSDTVAKLAAQKIIAKTPAGQFVNTGSGWQQR
ncbi:YdbL family protein [Methylosoma difficile]